jgi:hypothetical protein
MAFDSPGDGAEMEQNGTQKKEKLEQFRAR